MKSTDGRFSPNKREYGKQIHPPSSSPHNERTADKRFLSDLFFWVTLETFILSGNTDFLPSKGQRRREREG